MPQVSVVLVARATAARAGLRALIEADPNIRVVVEAASLQEIAAEDVPQAAILLVDAAGVGADDVALAESKGAGGLILIDGEPVTQAVVLASSGPVAILGSETSAQQLRAAVQAIALGLNVFDPHVTVGAGAPLATEGGGLSTDLTPREREVLQLVAAGLANRGIAHRLGISEHTVKFHVASVLMKLGAVSRAEAVAVGARRGLIAV